MYDVIGQVGQGPADLRGHPGHQAKSHLENHHNQDVGQPGASKAQPAGIGVGVRQDARRVDHI